MRLNGSKQDEQRIQLDPNEMHSNCPDIYLNNLMSEENLKLMVMQGQMWNYQIYEL